MLELPRRGAPARLGYRELAQPHWESAPIRGCAADHRISVRSIINLPAYIALLRAVNVGGTKLPMTALSGMCADAGFENVRTYIDSGKAVFRATGGESRIKGILEARLESYAGRSVGVLVRTATEATSVLAKNPFRRHPANHTVAIFLDTSPPHGALDAARGCKTELPALGARESHVMYADGIARSKLLIPAAKAGTARNMNTISRLAAMAAEI